MKELRKVASRVLETRDLIKNRVLETHFALAVNCWLGLKCPRKSRALKTRFLHSENRVFKTQYLIKHTHNSGKGLIKIWIELESYRLEFCWEKF